MNTIISIIIYLVIFGLIWYCITLLPLPAPFAKLIQVLFILLVILMLLSLVGILPGGHFPTLSLG